MSPLGPEDDVNPLDLAPEAADDLLAGELALGVLDGEEFARARARAASDPGFAERVQAWEQRLAPLAASTQARPAPPAVWSAVEDRLDAASPARPVDPAAVAPARPVAPVRARRRGAPLAWAAAFVSAIVAAGSLTALVRRPVEPPPLVAVLAPSAKGSAGDRGVVALYPVQGRAAPALGPAPAGATTRELWLIKPGGAPLALGRIGDAPTAPGVARIRSARIGDTVAVSLEPRGGPPTAAPTGPVVATGVLSRL